MADDVPGLSLDGPNLADLVSSLVAQLSSPGVLQRLETAMGNAHARGAVTAAGAQAASAPAFGELASKMLERLDAGADQLIAPLLSRLISHLLGIDAPTSALTGGHEEPGQSAIGRAVADTVIAIMPTAAGEISPGDDGAIRVVSAIASLTLKGWFEGILLEYVESLGGVLHPINNVSKLAEEVIHSLGLNRLGAQALRPYAQILVRTPLLWKLNKQYTPTLVNPADAIRHYFRGFWTYDQMYEVLARHGYDNASIEALMYQERKYRSAADVAFLVRNGYWTRDAGLEHLRESGLEADDAATVLDLEDRRELRAHQLAELEDAAAAYVDHRITRDALDLAFNVAGVDQVAKDRLHARALDRHDQNLKHVTLAQAEEAVKLGVWASTDYADYLDRVGYAHDDAITLELMLQAKLNKLEDAAKARALAVATRAAAAAARQQALQAKRDALARVHADFSGSLGQAHELVVRGRMSTNAYSVVLTDHGLSADDAIALAQLAGLDAEAYAAAQAKKRTAAASSTTKLVGLATLEAAVKAGTLSIDDFAAALASRGFDAGGQALIVNLLRADLAHLAAVQATRTAAGAQLGARGLSLQKEENAVRAGVQTIDAYALYLDAHGFSPADRIVLVALLNAKISSDVLAAQLHARAAAKLAASHLSLSDEDKAVTQGLKTFTDYRSYLLAHGFTPDDADVLTELLQMKIGGSSAAASAPGGGGA